MALGCTGVGGACMSQCSVMVAHDPPFSTTASGIPVPAHPFHTVSCSITVGAVVFEHLHRFQFCFAGSLCLDNAKIDGTPRVRAPAAPRFLSQLFPLFHLLPSRRQYLSSFVCESTHKIATFREDLVTADDNGTNIRGNWTN